MEDTKAGARSSVLILCALAIIVTPLLAFGELFASSCFMSSCSAPAQDAPPPDSGPSVAFIFGIAVSVIGIALSTYTNQITARMVFGLVLGLTLFIGFLASIDDPSARSVAELESELGPIPEQDQARAAEFVKKVYGSAPTGMAFPLSMRWSPPPRIMPVAASYGSATV